MLFRSLLVEGGTVSLDRLHFSPARPVITVLPGSKLSGRQLILQGNLQIDTRLSDVELSLEDVVFRIPEGPGLGIVPEPGMFGAPIASF